MSNTNTTPDFVHIYKTRPSILLLNALSVFFFCITTGIPLLLFITLIVFTFQNAPSDNSIGIFFLCTLGVPIIFMSLVLIQVIVSFIAQFFSYVKTSSSGLEHKIWLYKHISCRWSDVDRIGKRWLFIDVVYLKRCEVIGPSLSLMMTLKPFRPYLQNVLPLSGYKGWPDGELAQDLRQYAPHLFQNEAAPQGLVLDQQPKDPDVLSQEERLLAALSHISIWFSFLGIVVPIVIWASQKEKSPYIAFQALQAVAFQGIAILLSLAASACFAFPLLGVFLIPLVDVNQRFGDILFGVIFVIFMASISLLPLGQIIFNIYGIVGAITTFQGKEFRYFMIANRLEKSLKKDARSRTPMSQ